jgi:hypothetical protein
MEAQTKGFKCQMIALDNYKYQEGLDSNFGEDTRNVSCFGGLPYHMRFGWDKLENIMNECSVSLATIEAAEKGIQGTRERLHEAQQKQKDLIQKQQVLKEEDKRLEQEIESKRNMSKKRKLKK